MTDINKLGHAPSEPEQPVPRPPQPEIPPSGPEPYLPSPGREPFPTPVPGPSDPGLPRPVSAALEAPRTETTGRELRVFHLTGWPDVEMFIAG